MSDEVVIGIQKNYVINLLEKGKRVDERELNEYRPIQIEKNIISVAEGSARVKLGNTDVLVGIKVSSGSPFPDTPTKGVLTTNAELVPMASPNFESGPPGPNAVELARVVDRGIRGSEAVDMEKLCIEEGEKVWIVFIDIHILDYDGNLFDAASIGAIAALSTAVIPAERFELEKDIKLPVNQIPVASTYVKIGDKILVDPGLEEELIADARLTVTTDNDGNIRAMQKALSGSFTVQEIQDIIKRSQEHGKIIRKLIKE